jgi:hypothetical protein
MRVILTGWRPGLLKISLNHLLREHAGFSLTSAKAAVDRLLKQRTVVVDLPSRDAAVMFLQHARELGAVGHFADDEDPPLSNPDRESPEGGPDQE